MTVKYWEVNGNRIEVNASGVTSNGRLKIVPPTTLRIYNSQPEDSGRYTCAAEINGKIQKGSNLFTVFS